MALRPRPTVARVLASSLVAASVGCSCGSEAATPPAAAPAELVATAADFRGYESWTRFDRGVFGFVPAHPDGATTVFVNRLPEPGSTTFPVGTIIVRQTEAGPREAWEVHAMVKRGGEFNPLGAVGWEYFDLRLPPEGEPLVPTVLWHGEGPENEGDGYATAAGGVLLGCNHCHGAVPENDSVIGAELQLESF